MTREWVSGYCKRQGFRESAEIADQIDRVLCYLYGDANTEEWVDYIDNLVYGIQETGETDLGPEEVVGEIINSASFCVACANSIGCEDCEFSALTGTCGDDGSLYTEFEEKYWSEFDW